MKDRQGEQARRMTPAELAKSGRPSGLGKVEGKLFVGPPLKNDQRPLKEKINSLVRGPAKLI